MQKFMFTSDREYLTAIKKYINTPLEDFDKRSFLRPLDVFKGDRLDTRAEAAQLLTKKEDAPFLLLERVSRWIPANPSKPNIIAQHDATYIALGKHDDERPVANAEIQPGQLAIEDFIREHRLVAVVGPRGSGKTCFMNYWLSRNSQRLEQEQKTTWFRIDVTKIYQIWKERKGDVAELFEMYNRVHSVYVILMYGGFFRDHTLIRHSGKERENAFFKFYMNEFSTPKYAKCVSTIESYFVRYVEHNKRRLEKLGVDLSRELVQHTILDADRAVMKCFDSLYQHVCAVFSSQDITNICIIDGIDNIAWTKENRFYVDSCRAIHPFYFSLYNRFAGSVRLVLAVRPETIDEIEYGAFFGEIGFNTNVAIKDRADRYPRFFKCWMRVPPAQQILTRKLSAARGSPAFKIDRNQFRDRYDDEKEYNEALDGSLSALSNDLSNFFEFIFHELEKQYRTSIEPYYKKDDRFSVLVVNQWKHALGKPEDFFLRVFFDEDVRALLDNLYRVLRVRRACEKMHVPLFDRPERMLQYVFLNGSAYMDTGLQIEHTGWRKDFITRGAVFPNVFWYNVRNPHCMRAEWYGLCGLRVLQTLRYCKNILAGDLGILISQCFGYPVSLIAEAIEAFVAFGLIEVRVADNGDARSFVLDCTESDTLLRQYKIELSNTQKALLYLEYIWTRPDILYYFALDTPLGVGFVDDQRLIQIYRDFGDLHSLEDFFVASIPTAAVFLRHVKHFHTKEMHAFDNRFKNSPCDLSRVVQRPDQYKRFLDLPPLIEPSFERIVSGAIHPTTPDKKDRAERLKLNIEGVISYGVQ